MSKFVATNAQHYFIQKVLCPEQHNQNLNAVFYKDPVPVFESQIRCSVCNIFKYYLLHSEN